MRCKRGHDREGIRFLDEEPEPIRPAAGAKPTPTPAPKPRRREWPVGVMSFLAVVGVGIAMRGGVHPDRIRAEEVIEDRFEVGPAPRIEVEAFEGSVRIRRGDEGTVSCRVRTTAKGPSEEGARLEVLRARASVEGSRGAVRVRVDRPKGPAPWSGHSEVRLDVPADAEVRVATGNGRVRVERIRGSIAVRTENGRIEVERGGGPIALKTSNGAIACEATGAVVSAETSNGSITFRGSLAPGGSSRLVAGNGSISLCLPEDARYRIDAEARNGRVDSEFPIGRGDGGPGVVLARDDGPEARIEVRTANGSIRVERD